MLKFAVAASFLLAICCVPTVWADDSGKSIGDLSGFGSASMPSQESYAQTDERSTADEQPLSASAANDMQTAGKRKPLNLAPVATGMPFKGSYIAPANISLQREGLSELQPARFATLSDRNQLTGELLPA
ncbi:MAG: hypothetical protein K2X81_08520, partial [Candidatus Obscuribacterales bacterium]|nr:hypothetical protein [Candidatus Obscuribacterales bacterium]